MDNTESALIQKDTPLYPQIPTGMDGGADVKFSGGPGKSHIRPPILEIVDIQLNSSSI